MLHQSLQAKTLCMASTGAVYAASVGTPTYTVGTICVMQCVSQWQGTGDWRLYCACVVLSGQPSSVHSAELPDISVPTIHLRTYVI